MLLDAGADINGTDATVGTALTWAAYYDHEDLAAKLLEKGADPNVQNVVGGTPLMVAATKGSTRLVQLLLDHGADAGAKDKDGKTALKWAQDMHRADVAKLLQGATGAKRKG